MTDNRTPLKEETRLLLDGTEYTIRRVLGRGGSSIVYDAEYTDFSASKNKRSIRIKEYYPYYISAERETDGRLSPYDIDTHDFEGGMELFEKAYNECAHLRESGVLTNYTVNAENIYDRNNTKYIVMTYDEGRVYENDDSADGDIISVLRHIKAVAGVIGEYHKQGLLYLDLKPENILVLSGNEPAVKLFDFDSVVHINEAKQGKDIVFSSSKGFSPPEQRQTRGVSESSDIFSIGALLFYKLSGRTVTDKDCELHAKYDFAAVREIFEGKINASLAKGIQDFFAHTIRMSAKCRYNSVNEVLDELDKLIKYAGKYKIVGAGVYCQEEFIGREDEIKKLDKMVEHGKIAVIHGMGGIGKRTLARYYACEHQKDYNHVLCLKYKGNILNTLNDKMEFRIVPDIGYDGRQESFDVLIDTIIEEQLLTDKDLIVIENLNEKDLMLDCNTVKFLRLPCKFLITTEIDYTSNDQLGKPLELVGMTDSEAYKLFRSYNDKKYAPEDERRIRDTIKAAGNHTLFVKLFAGGLKRSFDSVSQIYADGVGNIRWGEKNIFQHIEELLDIESLDEAELEIMRSLSLLDSAHINARLFISFFGKFKAEAYVRRLIDRGLIEFNSEKISLHPVISAIVYDRLNPTAENCPSITNGIIELIKNEEQAKTIEEFEELELIKESFVASVRGNNDLYARLIIEFCRNTNYYDEIPVKLRVAERICRASESREHYDMLKDIYMLTLLPCFYYPIGDYARMAQGAVIIANTALEYMRMAGTDGDEKVRFYFELAWNFGGVVTELAQNISQGDFRLLNKKTDALIDEALRLMENSGLPDSEKQEKTEAVGLYYYSLLYRARHYLSDEEFAIYKEKALLPG